MTELRKAAEMALDWFDGCQVNGIDDTHEAAVAAAEALRKALVQTEQECTCSAKDMPFGKCCKAQPEQEPVARVDYGRKGNIAWLYGPVEPDGTLLYTAPPSIEAAVLAEREACAKVCEKERNDLLWREGQTLPQGEPRLIHMASTAGNCAAAIRARGEK